jgi:hypothetical protein
MSDAGRIVFEEANLYAACLLLHVVVWRVWRPRTFHQWLPALAVIFLGGGVLLGWWLSDLAHNDGELAGHGRALHFVGLMALHLPASLVYIIGYTLISAFSPSVELLKLIERAPGLRRADIDLPYLRTIVGGDRLKNLVSEGMLQVRRDVVRLGPKADRIVRLVLWYRHTVGLPDETGG